MEKKQFSFHVTEREASMRLDKFLTLQFSSSSRVALQRLIGKGNVRVEGAAKDKDYRVHAGDEVAVLFEPEEEVSAEGDSSVPFSIVYNGKDFAVIDKPAGVVVHAGIANKKGTLANGLLARWPKLKGVGDDSLRPGIVHRLDKETSGLMVVAKTQPMFLWLKQQFKEGRVSKKYLALVVGVMRGEKGAVTAPIGRKGVKQAVVSGASRGVKKPKEAKTEFSVMSKYNGFTLVEVRPKTGRMHQIRVHLKHFGHPVAGDKHYASRKQQKLLPLERHFLHAAFLSFFLPNGKKAEFSSLLPKDLKAALDKVKGL